MLFYFLMRFSLIYRSFQVLCQFFMLGYLTKFHLERFYNIVASEKNYQNFLCLVKIFFQDFLPPIAFFPFSSSAKKWEELSLAIFEFGNSTKLVRFINKKCTGAKDCLTWGHCKFFFSKMEPKKELAYRSANLKNRRTEPQK